MIEPFYGLLTVATACEAEVRYNFIFRITYYRGQDLGQEQRQYQPGPTFSRSTMFQPAAPNAFMTEEH